MKKSFIKRITIVLVLLSTFVSMFAIFPFATNENVDEESFHGYSENMTLEALEMETNTTKDGNGNFVTPVNTSAPQITFLIPGYGCDASTWSNNYYTGISPKAKLSLAYNEKSLVEKIRDYSNGSVFLAEINTSSSDWKDSIEEEDDENEITLPSFSLYEYPDLCLSDGCK